MTVPSGGARRYVEQLSLALAAGFPEDQFWLLSDQSFELPSGAPSNLTAGRRPRNPLSRRWWLWGLRGEMLRLGVDLFHGTDFSVPYLPVRPSVMTLHDLSPWMEPAWHGDADRVRKRTPTLLRLDLATMVITPSKAVRKQAIERFRLRPERVAAVPHAAAPHFRPTPAGRHDAPYLLYVGTLEPRKNVNLLLEIWQEVRRHHPIDLILAGRRRADFPALPSEPGLQVLGLTTEQELPELYSGAVACLYPSYYEGFGLPVLEAMQCGAPVLASSDPAISEVAGEAAILLDAQDPRAWVHALEWILTNPQQRSEMREKGLARADRFSWPKTAQLTKEVYGQAAERFRKKA